MKVTTLLKLGQIGGVLLLAAGVAACTISHSGFTEFFLIGGALYASCRLAAWLRSPHP